MKMMTSREKARKVKKEGRFPNAVRKFVCSFSILCQFWKLLDAWSNDIMVRGLGHLCKSRGFEITGWLQDCYSLSFFRGRSNEYHKGIMQFFVKFCKKCMSRMVNSAIGLTQNRKEV